MASALSYELYIAEKGTPNGIATLDANGKVPASQLPAGIVNNYLGVFANLLDLEAEVIALGITPDIGFYAFLSDTSSVWAWNAGFIVPLWVNTEITPAAYNLLTPTEQKLMSPSFVIVP